MSEREFGQAISPGGVTIARAAIGGLALGRRISTPLCRPALGLREMGSWSGSEGTERRWNAHKCADLIECQSECLAHGCGLVAS